MARTATQPVLTDTASELPAAADPWNSAPFDRALSQDTLALVARLSPAQRHWLSGYLAGSLAREMQGSPEGLQAAPAAIPTTILFGSESGNAEALARQLAQRFAARGAPHRVLDMLECRKSDLEHAGQLVAIVSTHGDGDPPERAVPFFELLFGRRAPRLSQTRFAVLALGDSSYEQYCAAGRRLDARLEELGAQRALPRVECDVDFASSSTGWMESVLGGFAAPDGGSPRIQASSSAASAPAAPAVAQVWTRRNPFAAEILANHALTARGSTKDVRHVELSIEGSGIQYEPGDALGIVPQNLPAEVDLLITQLGFSPEARVEAGQGETSLREALVERFEIGVLSPGFVRRYGEATGNAGLAGLASDSTALRAWLYGRDLRDLITEHPARNLDAQSFARLLSPLAPRLYSIASSLRASPDEVHLTIGVVSHQSRGRARSGVVSGSVAGRAEGAILPVYLHRNEGFRLPADPATAIVMIGAGTGVAPYRGFLAEREAAGASGRNWLFFGDRSFELDFLYQAEWLAWRRSGLLTRLDVAFSRDQPRKVYVQHRLREQSAELWRWLQEGAHLYICGDASRMAPDVEQAVLEVARTHGGLDGEAAQEYLKQLRRERRYQKDVY